MTEWTIATYVAHNEALRKAEDRLLSERDRRYAEVKLAEREALRVKEEADRTALMLAREIQTYKDEKANELRSQIERERGSYAGKSELAAAVEKLEVTIKPVLAYMASQQGKGAGLNAGWGYLIGGVGFIVVVIELFRLLK